MQATTTLHRASEIVTHRSTLRALCARLLRTVGLRFANPTYAKPFALAWLLAFCIPTAYAASKQISIPTASISSSPEPLVAYLFKPAGAGPHPAVVMLHGCGGAYDSKGVLGSRHRMWGEYFASLGYEALMLDSFTSRDLKEICTVKFSNRTIKESERVGDAYAALAWLHQQNDVDAKRIAVLGWSHGAGVTLDVITHKPKSPQVGDGFKAAVSFYPGCTTRENHPDKFHPYAPLLVLIGESDDWTPAAPCKALTAAVAARGEPMSIVTYPDTYHDFDNPGIKSKHVRKEVPNGVNPGQGVTTAPNPEAREDAKKRVIAFFAEQLK
ncbi:MAG: Dienelactone hydrolase [Rhodocyclales bacterium]|nr:Dienelactone hydrolase [Rhodocyclales bacterium]